jgi:tetratricopeptide (TPR) repeat protein
MDPSDLVYLVGAGVSIDSPSGIPPGAPILDRLIRYVATDAPMAQMLRSYADPDRACMDGRARNDFLRFEGLIERIADIEPHIFSALGRLETHGSPNAMHCFLADQANAGALLLTTNFDCRIEQAGIDRHGGLRRFVVGRPISELKADPQLVKLHGSFSHSQYRDAGGKPVATLTQIARLGLAFSAKRGLRKYLLSRCAGRTLVVAGYSASDSFDVTPLIETLPWRSVIWLRHHRQTEPDLALDTKAAGLFGELVLFEQPLDMLCASMMAKSVAEGVLVRNGPTAQHLLALTGEPERRDCGFDRVLIEKNLSALDEALARRPMNEAKRTFICRALLDESYGRMIEVEIGEAFAFAEDESALESHWEEIGQLIEARQFVSALAELEHVLDSGDTYYAFEARLKAKLEFAELMFNDGEVSAAMATALSADRLARAQGCVWALVQSQQLLAKYELDKALHASGRRRRSMLRRAHARHGEAIYYALRCGYIDEAFDTLRLMILTRDLLGGMEVVAYQEGLLVLLPHVRSPEVLFSHYEELLALAIVKGDRPAYRRAMIELERLRREIPNDVFAVAIAVHRGRWNFFQGRKYLARRWLARAQAGCTDKRVTKRFAVRIDQLARELSATGTAH